MSAKLRVSAEIVALVLFNCTVAGWLAHHHWWIAYGAWLVLCFASGSGLATWQIERGL